MRDNSLTQTTLSDAGLDLIFRKARTHNGWSDTAVPEAELRAIYDLARMGSTSANGSPARFVFCTSVAAREKLAAFAMTANAEKIRAAPVTVIIGMDLEFHTRMDRLFPHSPVMGKMFAANAELARETAFRNSSLQGAYLMLAARAMGLNCGPMSGFDKSGVDAAFFAGTRVESNFICVLGHGTDENLFARSPRLAFEEACQIL